MTALFVSTSALTLAGCASESTIVEVSEETGTSQAFSARVETVSAAAASTLTDLGLNLKDTTTAESGAVTLVFSKPVSAFSWGEVGKIVISPAAGGAQVTVISRTRAAIQLFGTTQTTFAGQIFAGISSKL